jgi:deoxyribodipyrimidine photolyase-related protein
MTRTLRFILGDQLSMDVSSLAGADKANDAVLMAEVHDEANYVPHHKKKLVFLFSAMRHHAEALREAGFNVIYHRLDSENPCKSFTEALKRAIAEVTPDRVAVTEPGEWRVRQIMEDWTQELDVPVEILPDTRFIASHDIFREWAKDGRKSLRMEYFYREMRRLTGYLMRGGEPEGGQWNYDSENREGLPHEFEIPKRPFFRPDGITNEVISFVGERFNQNFGDLEPFDYPVTRKHALTYLDWFIENALPNFGTYQDAMKEGEPLMFHSHLSALINCGLLDPRECCRRAEDAYQSGNAPLNAVEGFIRQIIGWREFIRGIYWLRMPGYGEINALDATRPLPEFFWTANTKMNCLRQAIVETKVNAYAHHIQRLMVIGNFCLLAGLNPKEVQRWYLLVYHDAYEWVEMPNVVGMILYADNGLFASKPYAASGAYIDRMSNYCDGCDYDVSKKVGEKACPFNYLYWDFLDRNAAKLKSNPRIGMIYKTLDRMTDARKREIRTDAARFLASLRNAY